MTAASFFKPKCDHNGLLESDYLRIERLDIEEWEISGYWQGYPCKGRITKIASGDRVLEWTTEGKTVAASLCDFDPQRSICITTIREYDPSKRSMVLELRSITQWVRM